MKKFLFSAFVAANLASFAQLSQARDLGSDVSSTTQTPLTVDKGRYQLDLSALDYTKVGGSRDYNFLRLFAKFGVLDSVDLELTYDGFRNFSPHSGRAGLRAKVSVFEGDSAALALVPFISVVTTSNPFSSKLNPGFVAPFSYRFNDRTSLGLMLAFERLGETTNSLLLSAKITQSLSPSLAGYLEYAFDKEYFEGSQASDSLNLGVTHNCSADMQLFVATGFGLNANSDDFHASLGGSYRF